MSVRSAPISYKVSFKFSSELALTGRITVTAGGKNYLKSLPLSKLRKYANAYNIKIDHAVEKEDVIEAVINARVGHAINCKSRCSCDIRA